MNIKQCLNEHQWIVFILGLLTGALLVTVVFTYQASQNLEGALLKLESPTTSISGPQF